MLALLLLLLIPELLLNAQELPAEQPLTDTQKSILAEGIRLHDEGKFSEAIERYLKVLEQNPASAVAWYELAFAQTGGKQWGECVASARKGLAFSSALRPGLFMELGNCQDASGDATGALESYQNALTALPPGHDPKQKAMILFNLGLAYHRQKEYGKAKEQLQQAIELNPRHGSSHLQLADIYVRSSDNIPALLALGVFLVLEPVNSPRVPPAVEQVRRILGAGVSRTGPKTINVTVAAGSENNPEGDFGPESVMMGLLGAADLMGDNKKRKKQDNSEFGRMESRWSMLLGTMLRADRLNKLANTFAARNYFSFYRGLEDRKLTGAFVSYIIQTTGAPPGPDEKKALAKSEEFRRWVADWPGR